MLFYCIFYVSGKKTFKFRGCGWKAIHTVKWSDEKKKWIKAMDELFNRMFGGDFLQYYYDKEKGTSVSEDVTSNLMEYNHEEWENQFVATIANQEPPVPRRGSVCLTNKQKRRNSAQISLDRIPPKQSRVELPNADKSTITQATSSQEASKDSPILIEDEAAKTHQPVTHTVQHSALLTGMSACTTRAELAALHSLLPPVSSQLSHVKVVHKVSYTDPFTLMERPSESVINKAGKLLNQEAKRGNGPCGVQILGLGEFSQDGLTVLKQFSNIANTTNKVKAEAHWLSQTNCTSQELAILQDTLWHQSPTSPILRHGRKTIDVISFCDLIEERYIDSFMIDVCISKYLEESAAGHGKTLYLPTEFYDWMGTNNKNFKCQQLSERASLLDNFSSLQQILVPVHIVNHWGLIYIDLANHHLYFDDGLMSCVPAVALPYVKEALDLILEMYPNHASLQTKFWKSFNCFSRFGMPSQVPVNSRMIGVGSCGIGVILAARDFVRNGPTTVNNIRWRYCDMNIHRKELMLQILKWS